MTEVVTGKMVILGVVVVVAARFDEGDEVDAVWPEAVVAIDVDWAETCGKRDEESKRHDRRPNLVAMARNPTMFEDNRPLAVLAADVDYTSTT